MRLAQLPPLALYVHIPWCLRKCPYCDFNSHEKREELPEGEYVTEWTRDRGELVRTWTVVEEAFAATKPPSTLLGVALLGYPDQLVEIEAVAVAP